MTKRSEQAQFIQWNDGFKDARAGRKERSQDTDYIAGYRYAVAVAA